MNRKKGYITKKIAGEVRIFHFSINAWLLLCEIHNIGLEDLNEFLLKKENQGVASRDLLYCGALAYVREKELPEDFNRYTAGLWYEEMSLKDYQDIQDVIQECSFLQGKKKR